MPWRDKRKPGPILIVEDDWDILEVLKLMLEDEGHAVVTAKHGREALAAMNARPFDAVLMDISMPDMSGIEIAQALRANEKTRDIRIVIHTGLDEAWVRERFTDYDLFLTKAADTDVLVEKVGALLATKRGTALVSAVVSAAASVAAVADTPASAEADAPSGMASSNEPITFTLADTVRVIRALRSAAGEAAEPMRATDFVRRIEADAQPLRRRGLSNPDIAALIEQALGRPFPAAVLDAASAA